MTVLFYDGNLSHVMSPAMWESVTRDFRDRPVRVVDARSGPGRAEEALSDIAASEDPKCVVVTNSLVALDNDYCWNEETNSCDLYLFNLDIGGFIKAERLTDKEIRRAHNLEKMYRAGAFTLPV